MTGNHTKLHLSPHAFMTVSAGQWLISLPAVSKPGRMLLLSVLGVMNSVLRSATLMAVLLLGVAPSPLLPLCLRRCAAPRRRRDALPGVAPQYRPCHSRGAALVIVAIGSSSTQGVGASDQAHTYPALLAEELRRRWPRLAVTVVNKGVGGENAEQMLARFTRDVLPYHPQLVIWQTGNVRAPAQGRAEL